MITLKYSEELASLAASGGNADQSSSKPSAAGPLVFTRSTSSNTIAKKHHYHQQYRQTPQQQQLQSSLREELFFSGEYADINGGGGGGDGGRKAARQNPPPPLRHASMVSEQGCGEDLYLSSSSSFQLPSQSSKTLLARVRRPFSIFCFTISAVLILTFAVLYWNYYETLNRRLTKKQGVILDHWGKGAPSKEETADLLLLLPEVSSTDDVYLENVEIGISEGFEDIPDQKLKDFFSRPGNGNPESDPQISVKEEEGKSKKRRARHKKDLDS